MRSIFLKFLAFASQNLFVASYSPKLINICGWSIDLYVEVRENEVPYECYNGVLDFARNILCEYPGSNQQFALVHGDAAADIFASNYEKDQKYEGVFFIGNNETYIRRILKHYL